MASTSWIGTREFYPGNIVPGFEEAGVVGTATDISLTVTLVGAGIKHGIGSPTASITVTLAPTGNKVGTSAATLTFTVSLVGSGAVDPDGWTAVIGSPASRPGHIIPGLGATSIVLSTPSVAGGDLYRVQVFKFSDTNYGIGELLAEFDRVHSIGHADYINNVPEAFFSLNQDDPKAALLRGYEGRAHVRILRYGEIVWTGWTLLERDANPADAIIYCYGYLAGLYWMLSDWKQSWTSATLAQIVSDAWVRAQSGLSNSRLGFVSTGTIQSPPTTSGGSTPITLPTYEAYRKRLLFLMQEMAAIGASDTGNTTMFEITHEAQPKFNFWTDHRQELHRVAWEWGDGRVQSYRDYGMPVYHRNAIYAVGQQPRNLVLQHTEADTTDMTTGKWGRMEDSLFLAWVRDETELERVTKLRAAKAKRDDVNLILTFFPHAEPPPGVSQSRWKNGDTVNVRIDRGLTNIDTRMQIVGYMTIAMSGVEQTRVLLQEPV